MQFGGKVAPGLGDRGRPSETVEALRGSACDLDLPRDIAELLGGRPELCSRLGPYASTPVA